MLHSALLYRGPELGRPCPGLHSELVAGQGHRCRPPDLRSGLVPNPQEGPPFSLDVLTGKSPHVSPLVLHEMSN